MTQGLNLIGMGEEWGVESTSSLKEKNLLIKKPGRLTTLERQINLLPSRLLIFEFFSNPLPLQCLFGLPCLYICTEKFQNFSN